MTVAELRDYAGALQRDISRGPVVPDVTPEEIRRHLESRYRFAQPMALDDVIADVEQMMRQYPRRRDQARETMNQG